MTNQVKSRSSQTPLLRAPILVNKDEAQMITILNRQEKVSRTDISNITGWSKAKTSHVVQNLISRGYLFEIGEGLSQGGRKPRLLSINDQLGLLVGLDIGATSMDIVLTDVCGKILQRHAEQADVRKHPEEFLNRCTELILGMVISQGRDPEHILGIGVGVPGPVQFSRGVLVAPPLMPDWENFPIREFFQRTFYNTFVVVDNDVNIMAISEQRNGEGAGIENFIFVKIGTGIGSGIVSNSKLHRGNDGCAGDIGHILVDKQGAICRCGNIGCLEAMASGPAIAAKAMQLAMNGSKTVLTQMMEANGGVLRPEDVNAACREGDQIAIEIIRNCGSMIGEVLASLVNFFNPSHIFIGGGVTNFGNHLLVAIRRSVLRRSTPLATTNLSINFSHLGTDIGVTGAIALARDYLFVVDGRPFLNI